MKTVFSAVLLAISCADFYCFAEAGEDTFERMLMDEKAQYVEPFQVFDNVYYVGTKLVSAYVLKTSEGLILIDSLFGPYINLIPQHLRTLGLDPAEIKYVVVSHGHFDHAGGAYFFQKHYGSQVVMTQADYQLSKTYREDDRTLWRFVTPEKDIVAEDKSTLTLGDTTITFYITPGHTPGSLSLEFMARNGKTNTVPLWSAVWALPLQNWTKRRSTLTVSRV